jgi:hypothetical protein
MIRVPGRAVRHPHVPLFITRQQLNPTAPRRKTMNILILLVTVSDIMALSKGP